MFTQHPRAKKEPVCDFNGDLKCHNFSQQLAGPCLSGVSLINSVISSDLFITTQGEGNVQVKNMDCDVCTVHTEMGNCLLHSVKVGVASGKKNLKDKFIQQQ